MFIVEIALHDTALASKPHVGQCLKGLGHAILGNFSIDQMAIELTEITK